MCVFLSHAQGVEGPDADTTTAPQPTGGGSVTNIKTEGDGMAGELSSRPPSRLGMGGSIVINRPVLGARPPVGGKAQTHTHTHTYADTHTHTCTKCGRYV